MKFVTQMAEVSKSIPIVNGMLSSGTFTGIYQSAEYYAWANNNYLANQIFSYDSALWDTYDNCVAGAQITCKWLKSEQTNLDYVSSKFSCSAFKNTLQLKTNTDGTMSIGYKLSDISNQTRGKCNQQANLTTLSNVHEHCDSLKSFMATFQDLLGKLVLIPEVICKPFFFNPPYICTKAVSPSVPSIVSQSLAFTTSALAAVKAILFVSVKMFRKTPVADNSGFEAEHAVSNVAKPETIP